MEILYFERRKFFLSRVGYFGSRLTEKGRVGADRHVFLKQKNSYNNSLILILPYSSCSKTLNNRYADQDELLER